MPDPEVGLPDYLFNQRRRNNPTEVLIYGYESRQ
jgi:hypothetical protein